MVVVGIAFVVVRSTCSRSMIRLLLLLRLGIRSKNLLDHLHLILHSPRITSNLRSKIPWDTLAPLRRSPPFNLKLSRTVKFIPPMPIPPSRFLLRLRVTIRPFQLVLSITWIPVIRTHRLILTFNLNNLVRSCRLYHRCHLILIGLVDCRLLLPWMGSC